jgi:cell division protease FtsH
MVQYTEDDEYFLGRDMMRRKSYSEATAEDIDGEVRKIIKQQYDRAYDIIHGNRDKLELIANMLLEYETLEGAQVEEIVRTGRFTPPTQPPQNIEPPMGAQAATPLPEVMKPATPKLPGFGDAAPAPA